MNIFLDTTVFYDDPFLKKIHTEKLMNIASENEINIYVSRVVIQESKNHYKKKLAEHIKKVNDSLMELNQLPNINTIKVELPTVEALLKKYDEHYDELERNGEIIVVEYNNDILPELVDRSIQRKKPFAETKQEFRDAVIWLSYAELAESEKLENCILVTGNISDFAKDNMLHPDLLEDSNRFCKFFKNTYGLVNSKEFEPYRINHDLQELIDSLDLEDVSVIQMLSSSENYDIIYYSLITSISNWQPSDVDEDYFDPGYVETLGMDFMELKECSLEVLNRDIVINGAVEVQCNLDAHTYRGDDEYYSNGEVEIFCEVNFSGIYNRHDVTIESLEVNYFNRL